MLNNFVPRSDLVRLILSICSRILFRIHLFLVHISHPLESMKNDKHNMCIKSYNQNRLRKQIERTKVKKISRWNKVIVQCYVPLSFWFRFKMDVWGKLIAMGKEKDIGDWKIIKHFKEYKKKSPTHRKQLHRVHMFGNTILGMFYAHNMYMFIISLSILSGNRIEKNTHTLTHIPHAFTRTHTFPT